MLSLGTGTSSACEYKVGVQSPVTDRCISRLVQAFTANLDGEREWKKFYNSVPIEARSQYHRFNVFFNGLKLNIDNLSLQIGRAHV